MCIKKLVTCSLYAICIATLLVAISFMSVGSALAVGIDAYLKDVLTNLIGNDKLTNFYLASVYIMLAVGSMLFFTALVGCWGACCHSRCYLLMFNITAGIIVALVLVAGGLSTAFKSELSNSEQQIQNNFTNQVQFEYMGRNEAKIDTSWDSMQNQLSCCGASGFADWKTSEYYKNTGDDVPISCCASDVDYSLCKQEANKPSPDESILHTMGCIELFTDDVSTNTDLIMGISFSFGILNLIAVLAGCCLRNKLEED